MVLEAFLAGQLSSWLNDGGAAKRVVWLHAEPSCRAIFRAGWAARRMQRMVVHGVWNVPCVASQSSKNGDAAPEMTDWEGGDPRHAGLPTFHENSRRCWRQATDDRQGSFFVSFRIPKVSIAQSIGYVTWAVLGLAAHAVTGTTAFSRRARIDSPSPQTAS
jgi:hypothetical protein